ncbi:aspartate/methionine/tyrosine aminotransferase [Rhodovulum imhoffii]|uniref:Aspartate/methionine/tyrosine aminotransferase n=2 Tax=Rhodovulum imhoffii TaxID=365340 RepID=A0A2T5BUY1_9RHOB|nr:aspartate/methionine/tyrosine aminotransferase [Rhodovulum imhoffii]
MTIGEPRHPFPGWVGDVMAQHAGDFGKYPPNDGTPELRVAIAGYLQRRYGVTVGDDRIIPLNGTREGLFNTLLALCPEEKRGQRPVVLIPNPFYQVYGVAALAAGAEPVYVPATAGSGFLPDYTALAPEVLDRVAVAYLCSPSNPQGAVADNGYWTSLIELAETHDFKIFADECYCEIYRDAPAPGLLQIAQAQGGDPERAVVFHSLSKRSNLPGLRSGFVAGGRQSIERVRHLRAYAGAPQPLPVQRVAEHAWADDAHVEDNRALYRRKYAVADDVFAGLPEYTPPEAGFFLWLPVADSEAAALRLWRETGVRVLPGRYFSRVVNGEDPGAGYVRVALVAAEDEVRRGLTLIRDCLYQ